MILTYNKKSKKEQIKDWWSEFGRTLVFFYGICNNHYEVIKMLSLRSNLALKDLSQGSRIAFIRYHRGMTQHEVVDMFGVKHDNKRRIMTRYEKGQRNLEEGRIREIAKILNVSYSSIKQYDFKDINDIFIY